MDWNELYQMNQQLDRQLAGGYPQMQMGGGLGRAQPTFWQPDPRHLPAWDGGGSDGPQFPVSVSATDPVYSVYTSKLIGYGPQPYGKKCDAPIGHPNHGDNFHVIQKVRQTGEFMMHRAQPPNK